jgi:putative transcriptional regulator
MSRWLQGHFLVAAPELRDPNFFHTVVLLVQHNDDGALGLVLNRPSPTLLRKVWGQVSQARCDRDDALYVGGPVEGPLMAIHTRTEDGEIEVVQGVYFSSGREHLEALVTSDDTVRFFAGFAGWGAGQLESELAEGAWRTLPAAARQIFAIEVDLWDRLLKEVAGSQVLDALHIKHVPPDPSMN